MPEFETTVEAKIEFDVECDECGETLEVEASGPNIWTDKHQVEVTPCPTCIAEAVKEALKQAEEDRESQL
jgi:hypothetical protein